jgi:cation diffusion facilitator family transporter
MEVKAFELPEDLKPVFKKAKKLEWITLFYLISVVIVMYAVMGSSQAMKSATLEDALSMIPSICFLISSKIYIKDPNEEFPYGYHRVYGIAFLTGALALFGIGIFLVIDSCITLFTADRPTIGSIYIFGHQVWMGWIMIVVLVYSSVPSIILGLKKLPLSKQLHNKILYTDADTQKADYMTAFAAMAGVVGICAGWWWADAVAAILIGSSVLYDGITRVKTAVLDLMDRTPVKTEDSTEEPLVNEVLELIRSWHWVKDANVRFREHGQVFFGEVYIIPGSEEDTTIERINNAIDDIRAYHWKLHDITITFVEELPDWKEPPKSNKTKLF